VSDFRSFNHMNRRMKPAAKPKVVRWAKTAKRILGKLGTNKNDNNVNAVDSDQTA